VVVLQQGRLALNVTIEDLEAQKQVRRFMVNVNGTEPGVLMEALHKIGIGPERVTQVGGRFEEMLKAALAAGLEEGNEQG
jgi:hypothetical protein